MQTRPETKLPDHPVRIALLDLLAELGTVTANEAARRLGHSSGLCSFHLRQLARQGLIEEAPRGRGRIRPWRLRWESAEKSAEFDRPGDEPDEDAFSIVLHLTPEERSELTASIRELMKSYHERVSERADTQPVAAIFRMFPAPADSASQ